jgi:CRISPR-associated Csx2 family protein
VSKVLISFLGLGSSERVEAGGPGYDSTEYEWNGVTSTKTPFVQAAIVELLGRTCSFDRIVILCTKESKDAHYKMLLDELERVKCDRSIVRCPDQLIPTDMRAQNQWQWFETVLAAIDNGDEVVFDFTHGMRAVPIVFSSAIGFLAATKRIELKHVLYGWYDKDAKCSHPIIDMRDFYVVNGWSEAVSRLVEDADARTLAKLARESKVDALEGLGAPDLVEAFQAMTDCIRNVDVNRMSEVVNVALVAVKQHRERSSGSARVLLDCVWEKFRHLAADYPPSGRYDAPYFRAQLEIIRVLNEHRLYMQSFTAMRELIASFGAACLGTAAAPMTTAKNARRLGDVFVCMIQFRRAGWKFGSEDASHLKSLEPWYDRLDAAGIIALLKAIGEKRDGHWSLMDYRNGFDHAWTSKAGPPRDISSKASEYADHLSLCIERLVEAGLVETQ